jgi:hypothetical protein
MQKHASVQSALPKTELPLNPKGFNASGLLLDELTL